MITLVVDRTLEPSPDEAISLLRRELLKPEYFEGNWVNRLLGWLDRLLGRGMEAANDFTPLSTFAAMLVAVLLIGGLAWLIARTRPSARTPSARHAVLTDEVVTAAQLRARAQAALAEGRNEEALVDGFRALAVRQVERGRLEDTPGTTAQEAARVLSRAYPDQRSRVDGSALLFDSVLYGDRPASRGQAVDVLELDDELRSKK
ncbi:MAG: DUF4129 domain-containing protein [Actinomycetota bacterium]|nr:DUF4129 domain-containing protein [Actinomycetota bacterium]